MADYCPTHADDINCKWEQVTTAFLKTTETWLSTNQKEQKEWITEDTWQTIEERRMIKKHVLGTLHLQSRQ